MKSIKKMSSDHEFGLTKVIKKHVVEDGPFFAIQLVAQWCGTSLPKNKQWSISQCIIDGKGFGCVCVCRSLLKEKRKKKCHLSLY
jgi:hypothetical protein